MSARLTIAALPMRGCSIINRLPVGDDRGWFERLYCYGELADAGVTKPIVQINRSFTCKQGTVRGLHYQRRPYAETKIVYCVRGCVMDVAVDLRRNSPTWCRHVSVELSAGNGKAIVIPEGFAHGFQTLTPDAELLYLHTAMYAPDAEGGIHPCDETIGVDWPLPLENLSSRDANLPRIVEGFKGITL